MPTPTSDVAVTTLLGRFEGTAIVLAVAFVVWRISVAVIDQIFARRFVSHHVPRVATFCTLAKSTAGCILLVVSVLTLLHVWAVDVTPAVWSAGLITAGLAFGSQTVVRDIITGFFFLFEDQYDVGDRVQLVTSGGQVITGRVSSLGLRTTAVLDRSGSTVVVSNGYIALVTNSARVPDTESFTVQVPWHGDAATMREHVAEHVREAVDAGAVQADQVSVSLADVTADGPVFKVELRSQRANGEVDTARIREALVSRLQADGWLPKGGDAAPGSK
jgi:moderate conductance mechanosensitive channel